MRDQQFYIGVKAVITNADGEVLILRKVPRRPTDKWKPFWDLPGGKIKNQSIAKTLEREVYEELGVKNLEVFGLLDAAVANFKIDGRDKLMFLLYRCRIARSAKLRLSKEHDEYRWVGINEARKRLAFMLPAESLRTIR